MLTEPNDVSPADVFEYLQVLEDSGLIGIQKGGGRRLHPDATPLSAPCRLVREDTVEHAKQAAGNADGSMATVTGTIRP